MSNLDRKVPTGSLASNSRPTTYWLTAQQNVPADRSPTVSVWRPWSRRSVPVKTQLGRSVTGFLIHNLKTASARPEMLALASDRRAMISSGEGTWAAALSPGSPTATISTTVAAIAAIDPNGPACRPRGVCLDVVGGPMDNEHMLPPPPFPVPGVAGMPPGAPRREAGVYASFMPGRRIW